MSWQPRRSSAWGAQSQRSAGTIGIWDENANPATIDAPEIEKETQESYEDTDDQFALLWVAVPICALIITTAAFYFASPVLLPLAIASRSVAARLSCRRLLI